MEPITLSTGHVLRFSSIENLNTAIRELQYARDMYIRKEQLQRIADHVESSQSSVGLVIGHATVRAILAAHYDPCGKYQASINAKAGRLWNAIWRAHASDLCTLRFEIMCSSCGALNPSRRSSHASTCSAGQPLSHRHTVISRRSIIENRNAFAYISGVKGIGVCIKESYEVLARGLQN